MRCPVSGMVMIRLGAVCDTCVYHRGYGYLGIACTRSDHCGWEVSLCAGRDSHKFDSFTQ